MKYYYKMKEDIARQLFEHQKLVDAYDKMTVEWLKSRFIMDDVEHFIPFNDVPVLNEDILAKNPDAAELLNKTNNNLNRKKKESKELIEDWQKYKKENGYEIKQRPDQHKLILALRSIFPRGAVNTLMIPEENLFYLKADMETNSGKVEPITIKEYNMTEIRIAEKENKDGE